MARARPCLLRYGRFIWSRPKRQAQHCLPFLFPLYRLPYARYGFAIQRKFCSQLNRPRRSANKADSGSGYGRFIWSRTKERSESCTPFIFVRLSPQIRTDFPQTCRGESRFARQAEVKWVVEGCFSVSLAKSSVFSRRRKTHEEHIVFRGAMPPTDLRKKYSWRIAVSQGRALVSRRNYTVLSKPSPVGEGGTRSVRDKASISRRA